VATEEGKGGREGTAGQQPKGKEWHDGMGHDQIGEERRSARKRKRRNMEGLTKTEWRQDSGGEPKREADVTHESAHAR